MTVIRPNSISGINSITSNGGDISIFRADGSVSDLTINNITSGVVTATTFSGNLSGGTINATSGTVTGNLGVGGVLTYEDVTNIDSVGIITARTDVLVGSTIKLGASSGIITATSFRGDASQMTGAGLGTDGSANTSGIITASHFVPTSQGALSHRNLIINGDMRVAERGSSEVTVSHDTNTFRCDRFGFTERTGGSVGLSQSSTAPVGFDKSLYVRLLSTDTSLTGNEYSNIRYVVEDLDVKHLEWGTANAKSLTLTFYTYSNVAGQTFCLNVTNWPTNQRSFIAEYTRPSGTANTWLKHVINIPGDTTGTWTHITLQWVLAASADYTRSGTGWAAWSGSGGLEMATSNQYNWFSDANHFYLTGVQLEMGDTSTPFEHRSFSNELSRCQRYYYVHAQGDNKVVGAAVGYQGNDIFLMIYPKVTMRTAPSLVQATGTNYYRTYQNGGYDMFDSWSSTWNITENMFSLNANSSQGVSGPTGNGNSMIITSNAGASIAFNAEL